jgi:hypothetical protein
MLYSSQGRQTVAMLSNCHNFELNILALYIPNIKNRKPLYLDCMQISIQAVAILSLIPCNDQS